MVATTEAGMSRTVCTLLDTNSSPVSLSLKNETFERTLWPVERIIIVSAILGIVIIITTVGNFMTILVVRLDKRLKAISNMFICSLAAADLLVGLVVMTTFMVYSIVNNGVWYFGTIFCDVWQITDYSCCTASLTNVCVIAHDRYTAVSQPLKTIHMRTKARARVLIACAWIIPIVFWTVVLTTVRVINGHSPAMTCYHVWEPSYIVIISTVLGIYLPIIIILILFHKIMMVMRAHMTQMNTRMRSIRSKDRETETSGEENKTTIGRNERKRSSGASSVKFSGASKVRGYFLIFSRNPRRWRQKLGSIHSQSTSASEGAVTEDPSTSVSDSEDDSPNEKPTCNKLSQKGLLPPIKYKDSTPVKSYRSVGVNTSLEHHVSTIGTNTSPLIGHIFSENVLIIEPPEDPAKSSSTSARCSPELKRKSEPGEVYSANLCLAAPKLYHSVEANLNKKADCSCPLSYEDIKRSASFTVMPRLSSNAAQTDIKANAQLLYGEFMRAERYMNQERIRLSNQISAAKTLGVIMGVLLLCWIPFGVVWPIRTYCHACISQRVYDIAVWINYLNSTVNPVIYCLCNQNFQRAYKRLLKRCS